MSPIIDGEGSATEPVPVRWRVRGLTGALPVRDPKNLDHVRFTTGGYVVVDSQHKEEAIGPFRTSKAATVWAETWEHTEHAMRGENHWFTCGLCDDEEGS